VVEYAVFTLPAGTLEVEMARVVNAALIEKVNCLAAVCGVASESVTLDMIVYVPDAFGMPEMIPAGENVTPVGREPEARLQM
jgi:hypothetical protein